MNIVLCSREDESRALSHGLVLCTPEEAEKYLMHYRTEGSKNGQRLYQYKDGSLTPLGRIHYGVGQSNRSSRKAEKYAQKAQKAQAKYEKATNKAIRAQDRAVRKNLGVRDDQKSKDRLAEAILKQEKAKSKMEEYRNKAEIYNSRAKQKEEERQRKLESDTKGLDSDSANKLREAVSSKIDSGKNADKMFEEMDKRNANIDEHKFRRDVERFDKLSYQDKKKVGDEVLRRVHDFDYKSKDGEGWEDSDEANELRSWMFKRIDSKSGNWNVGESVSKGNQAAMDKMDKAYDQETERIRQVKKEIDYVDKDRNEREHPFLSIFTSEEYYNSESKRLKAALKTDKVYQALKEASREAEKDLCGAVLKDIGFSDTPENRSLIFPYVFLD